MKKYHKTDIAPVEQENERDETYQASNPQIDCRRTGSNYHIVKRQRSYTQFINDKIEALDLPTKVRKDAVLASLRSATAGRISSPPSSTRTKPRRTCT